MNFKYANQTSEFSLSKSFECSKTNIKIKTLKIKYEIQKLKLNVSR